MIDDDALRTWLQGLGPETAARALAVLGVDVARLAAARVRHDGWQDPTLLPWTLGDEAWRHRRGTPAALLATLFGEGAPVRLSVGGDALPPRLLAGLLAEPAIAAAFVAVQRPPGSLRRRPWRWPLRLGLAGTAERAAEVREELEHSPLFPSELVDVRAVEFEPGAVDVLVLDGPLERAVTIVQRLQPVANAVLVRGRVHARWPLVEAQLASLRAITAAVASAVVGPARPVPVLLAELVFAASHAESFDVALTRAAGRELLLAAEPDAMRGTGLAQTTRRAVGDVRRALAEPPPPAEDSLRVLEAAATGAFASEVGEASTIAGATVTLEAALEQATPPRWLQARLAGATPGAVVTPGTGAVDVFVGALEAGAAAAPAPLDESGLPWEQQAADAFALTVVLLPLTPRGPPQEREVVLPRFGRSTDARFELDVPGGGRTTARLVVLFRRRVLQTAVLVAADGEALRLEEAVALQASLTNLDDRRAFDLALVANHAEGEPLLAAVAGRVTVTDGGTLPAYAARIGDALARAVHLRVTAKGLRTPKARALLVDLAGKGRDLFNELERELDVLGDPDRVQVTTARGQWSLPVEALYARPAPDLGAVVCERWLEDPEHCRPECSSKPREVVCPGAFWGVSKTIERHHWDPRVEPVPPNGHLLVGRAAPAPGRRDVTLRRGLLAASRRVAVEDVGATVDALGGGVRAVAGWQAWIDALEEDDTDLLVLLPHTDYREVGLEVSADVLRRSQIEREHVTGSHDVEPVVVLFGCRTTGRADDPAGFATRFMTKGARAVFHSSTDLLNVHATALTRQLVGRLLDAGRDPRLLSELLSEFRREALRGGWVAALAVSALGDADRRL